MHLHTVRDRSKLKGRMVRLSHAKHAVNFSQSGNTPVKLQGFQRLAVKNAVQFQIEGFQSQECLELFISVWKQKHTR